MTLLLLYILDLIKMKTLFVIAVLTCFFVMGMTQTLSPSECLSRATQVNTCTMQLASAVAAGGDAATFCNDCKTQLTDFFQACGGNTAGLQRGKQLLQYYYACNAACWIIN